MAVYATLPELKGRIGITGTAEDAALTRALAVASRGIETFCRRSSFFADDTATPRVFPPLSYKVAHVHDFHTTDGLVVATDDNEDGTFETTWLATDYELEPLNGIANGQAGWPYSRIRSTGRSRWFPHGNYRRGTLQVTAKWGWAEVPDAVVESCLIVAEETWKIKDAPFGVAGFGEFGALRVRENQMAAAKLSPYVDESAGG